MQFNANSGLGYLEWESFCTNLNTKTIDDPAEVDPLVLFALYGKVFINRNTICCFFFFFRLTILLKVRLHSTVLLTDLAQVYLKKMYFVLKVIKNVKHTFKNIYFRGCL